MGKHCQTSLVLDASAGIPPSEDIGNEPRPSLAIRPRPFTSAESPRPNDAALADCLSFARDEIAANICRNRFDGVASATIEDSLTSLPEVLSGSCAVATYARALVQVSLLLSTFALVFDGFLLLVCEATEWPEAHAQRAQEGVASWCGLVPCQAIFEAMERRDDDGASFIGGLVTCWLRLRLDDLLKGLGHV